MPELPEVQHVVDTLRPLLLGRTIVRIKHFRTDMLTTPGVSLKSKLARAKVREISRRAKRIVIGLSSGERFFIHLGMTGALTVTREKTRRLPHTHLVAELDNGAELRYVDPRRFGEFRWLGTGPIDEGVGPEPFAITGPELRERLNGTRRAVKTALLDQKLIAGIGNIYADEALFAAQIHPKVPGTRISADEAERLCAEIKRILLTAIAAGGSSVRDYVDAEGKRGAFQNAHQVYDKKGQPCVRCQTPIQKIVLGGRSTSFCPHCQVCQKRRSC